MPPLASPESRSIPLRGVLAGVAVFAALRLVLVLSASDLVHPPDWAEVARAEAVGTCFGRPFPYANALCIAELNAPS